MNTVDTIAIHQFDTELLVEVIGTSEHGDVETVTIEFDIVEADNNEITPRDDIPAGYEKEISTILSDKGYSVAENVKK